MSHGRILTILKSFGIKEDVEELTQNEKTASKDG
jgi:hypothetical protein